MAGCLEKWDIIPNVYIEFDFYKNDDTAKRFDFKSGGELGIELLDHILLTAGFNWGLRERVKAKLFDDSQKRNQLIVGISCLS